MRSILALSLVFIAGCWEGGGDTGAAFSISGNPYATGAAAGGSSGGGAVAGDTTDNTSSSGGGNTVSDDTDGGGSSGSLCEDYVNSLVSCYSQAGYDASEFGIDADAICESYGDSTEYNSLFACYIDAIESVDCSSAENLAELGNLESTCG